MNTWPDTSDILVLGGTPSGIAAAIAAARMGRRVVLIERHGHLGGMSASGLGKSDVEKREFIGGLFKEFTSRVHAHYRRRYGADSENLRRCREGYYFEPSVAEAIFEEMAAECPNLTTLRSHRLVDTSVEQGRLRAVQVRDLETGDTHSLNAAVFVDATYEGDLYAAAGAACRVGRESRDEFGESLAGVIYYDYDRGLALPGSTGEGDERLTAYTYRLCLTVDPENAVPLIEPPDAYDRSVYTPYFDDLEAGRLRAPAVFKEGRGYNPEHFDTLVRALSVTELLNGKTDVNINPRPLAFPFPEENAGYADGDWETRQRIEARHRELTLGLLWFLQNDPEIPEAHRAIARRYHLPRDEFADSGHFPWQLYVREARRLEGLYTLTQHDVAYTSQSPAPPRHPDVIATGEFPIDSFPVRKRQPRDTIVLEGYLGMLGHLTRPYPIPYRSLIPRQLEGIIVPCALSATHVAYSSIRMEPTWMALGHAAGVAAHLAVTRQCPPRDVPIDELQHLLAAQGQVF
jgi:hypothetical protein